jgi:hypothetical protein
MSLSVGGVGMVREEVTFVGAPMLSREAAWQPPACFSSTSRPIGQVFFVPREAITMRPCTSEELSAIEESRQEFNRQKAATVQKTSYGLAYSPHYLRQSRQKSEGEEGGSQLRGTPDKPPRG